VMVGRGVHDDMTKMTWRGVEQVSIDERGGYDSREGADDEWRIGVR
jgi:hypothetical protein